MIRAEAEPLPDGTPGYARIVITGAPEPAGRVTFEIRREGYGQGFLGRNGWQVSEELLAPVEVLPVPEAGGWAMVLGPDVSRHLTSAPYLFRVPALGADLPIFWPDIEDEVPGMAYVPRGGRQRDLPEPPARRPEPPPPPPPPPRPAPQPVSAPPALEPTIIQPPAMTPVAEPPPVPIWKKPWPWAALVLLAVLGGGLYAFRDALFGERAPRVEEARPGVADPPAARPATPPPRPDERRQGGVAWPEGTDGFTPREVASQAADAAAILRVAQRRQSQGRHDDARELLEEAAARDEPEAAFSLARLLDPVGFVPGRPFREPNAHEAAKLYQQAVGRGHAPAEGPRAALRAFLDRRAAAGDAEARMTIAEFWP